MNGIPEGVFWALIGFAWVFGWLLIGTLWSHQRDNRRLKLREILHRERMASLEKGIDPGEVDEKLAYEGFEHDKEAPKADPDANRRRTLLAGLVMTMFGLGLSLSLLLVQVTGQENLGQMWPLGLVFVFVGAGLLAFPVLSRKLLP